jgi:hypothetical protein
MRTAWFAVVLALSGVTGCKQYRPPYAPGQGPEPEELLAVTGPQTDAIQVSSAKVVLNRALRGDLAFIAQAPARFRGGVNFKGNELVTLALHEGGYALRNKSDALPTGFYEGPPPADCAVEAMLGVRFAPEGMVALVLGGAPVLPQPYRVVGQKWSRKEGYEALTLEGEALVQELRFAYLGGGWHVVGGQLWERSGKGKGRLLWSIEQLGVAKVGDAWLPERTRLRSPAKRGDNLVVIIYKERSLDPAFAKSAGPDEPEDVQPEDWGDDEGGWEDGTEDGSAEATDSPDEPVAEPAATDSPARPEGSESPEPAPSPAPVPSVFLLEPSGLPERGDLCR